VQKAPFKKRHNFRISLKKMEVKEKKTLLGKNYRIQYATSRSQ
jgi:hypothetical protein